ncbi:MAG: hypothetical protein F4Y03_09850 [Alphaproteobacteria bacterium]|nr:hypothetical protein [Alphaproteobacteria bacterium]
MRLVCTHFDYEFRLQGRKGGLNETRWIFDPVPDPGDGSAEIRDGMLAASEFHRELLDRVFAGVLKGGGQPVLSGGEQEHCDGFAVTSGYQYAGRLTWRGRRHLHRRLERLFGETALPMRRRASPDYTFCTFHANTGLRFSGRERPSDLHLWVSHNLPPPVNACLFRHLLALDAFGFASELTGKVERLDALLAAAASEPGAGGYAVPPGLWHAGGARRRLPAG